ncbi:MAG: T9SS type A sorting domain-containing protein [Bacteroidia bacterium]
MLTITLCDAEHNVTQENGPAVFVMIIFKLRTCNGITSIIIDNYVVVDRRDLLRYLDFTINLNCTIPEPMTAIDLQQAVVDAINRLLSQLGNPTQGQYEIYFKGACYSLVQLSFPNGAFFTSTPDDLGKIDTFYLSANSTITQSIPCCDDPNNQCCCKVTYRWQVVTLSNGETISKWVPVSIDGDNSNPPCASRPIPNYTSYTPKLEAQIFDPVTGLYQTVNGNFISQTPCEMKCPRFIPSPPEYPITSVKTDLGNQDANIQLTASPIPFGNYIKISSNKPILKAVVYDMKGKKVLRENKIENGQINTAELKEGVYYIQVYFDNNNVKTLKVIKQ